MRTSLLLSTCLLATACGQAKTYKVEPQLQPYVDRYVKVGQEVGKTVVVDNLVASVGQVGNVDWAGQCTWGDPAPTIVINSTYWNVFDDTQREQVMFHELGHCVLGRQHNNDVDSRNTPVSIMFATMQPEYVYTFFRADWIVEMFWYKGPEEQDLTAGTTIN